MPKQKTYYKIKAQKNGDRVCLIYEPSAIAPIRITIPPNTDADFYCQQLIDNSSWGVNEG